MKTEKCLRIGIGYFYGDFRMYLKLLIAISVNVNVSLFYLLVNVNPNFKFPYLIVTSLRGKITLINLNTNVYLISGGRSDTLRKVNLLVVDNDQCQSWYTSQGKKTKILDTQMCAGVEVGGRDSCWVSTLC